MIPFHDFGGTGEVLYFFHANGFPPFSYTPLVQTMLPQYHVISMLARPMWPGSEPKLLKDWQLLRDDLIRFLGERQESGVIGVGHSMGGTTMLMAALRNPALFRAIVLLDPVLFSPWVCWWWGWQKRLGLAGRRPYARAALRRRRQFKNLEVMYQSYRQKPVFGKIADAGLKAYVEAISRPGEQGQRDLLYPPEWEAQIYTTAPHTLWKYVKTLKVPLLVVWGENSNVFEAGSARAIRQRLPLGIYHGIPGATHLVPLEKPLEVGQMILQFLASCPPAPKDNTERQRHTP